MRILSLDLENVKSYARQRIEFTSGLNAVCGLNGSGKTTVLEAIGFALFDFLPYNQSAFVREGQKAATIRVQVLARDERAYEIVRRIGGGSAYYVADLESGTRLAERSANVLEWIRTRALGMDGAADLESLFKNAVGVPQGLITADFLQSSATARKSIFDPLLRVEEYREAYENLRDTASYVKNLSGTISAEITHLEAETEPIPQLHEQVADLEAKIHDVEEHLGRLAAEQSEIEARKRDLDAAEQRCREAAEKLKSAEYDRKRFGDMLEERRRALASAWRARDAVDESEPGYRVVLAARERLRGLDEDRKTRDDLNAQSASVTARMSAVHGRMEGLRSQWQAALKAEHEATELEDLARRQDELDAALAGVAAQLGERQSLDRQSSRMRDEISSLLSAMTAAAQRMREAETAAREVKKVEEVRRDLEAVRSQLSQMEPSKKQLQGITEEGQRLRREHDEVDAEVKRRDEVEKEIARLAPEAAALDDLNSRQRSLRDELVRAQATIEYQNVARAELRSHHCPLLDLTCPAVERDVTVLDRFDERVSSLDVRVRQLESELAQLVPAVEAAQSAADQVRELELHVAQLTGRVAQRDALRADLNRCRARYAEIAELVKGESELVARRDWLSSEESRLQQLSAVAALLPELADRKARDEQRLESLRLEETRLAEIDAGLRAAENRQRGLERELRELGDPRGRRNDLVAIGRRAPELSAQLDAEQRRLDEETDRLKAVVGQLQRFELLDEAIDEQRKLEAQHAGDYERYLRHREEAARLEERQTAADEIATRLASAEAAVVEMSETVAAADAAYDRDRHEEVREQHNALGKSIAAKSEERKYHLQTLQRTETDLARLTRRLERLQQSRAELNELDRVGEAVGFIRRTINLAGPAVTEALVANISQTANDIYEEIMDDHAAELRWNRDYEVIVQRGAEERKFAQLSGGEQMSAALAVRLALLREMSDIDFAFFDEPTQNMDVERRANLAEQIQAVRGFEQLIVISHDDTFEHHTDNLIRLQKIHEETRLDSA